MKAHNLEYLDNLRHSASHLLAAAILQMYPDTKITLGPPITDGFYYDFDFTEPISEKDFPKIEKAMRKIVTGWDAFEGKSISAEDALKLYADNPYKLEIIEGIVAQNEDLTLFTAGNFTDLCRGGHVENPKKELMYFKLLSVAGAYWRGDEKNKMLTRIYGTAFPSQEELDAYLHMIEEAKKRDHKILGKQLGLFAFSDLVGSGLPLWTPKGTLIRTQLDDFVWQLRQEKGYQKVAIPHITKKDLYEKSGHWDKFSDELFKITTREGHEFAMKPMNCPHHTQIFASEQRSYKDLPQRYTETTMVYRDEQTGELSGLSRVRSITQDDAHVFCRYSQVEDEVMAVWDIVNTFYSALGFELKIRLSLHDSANMEAYLGSEAEWLPIEDTLRNTLKKHDAEFYEAPGEAAFYGPKIDFMSYDSLGREWQVATIQLDINMPNRFNLYCINEQGEQERIIMIHAAIMGSIERFTSILIEHYAGAFPTWLAPVQVAILPVSEKHDLQASAVEEALKEEGIRVIYDSDSKTLGAKIREWTLQKVPYMCIIGDTEAQKSQLHEDQKATPDDLFVSIRTREGKDYGMTSVSAFVKDLLYEIRSKKTTTKLD